MQQVTKCIFFRTTRTFTSVEKMQLLQHDPHNIVTSKGQEKLKGKNPFPSL